MNKKKLWTRTSLGLAGVAMALGVGVSLGGGAQPLETKGAAAPIYQLDTSTIKGKDNTYAGDEDIDIGGITWNVTGNTTVQPWRIGGKNLTNFDREVFSKTAMPYNIGSIDLTLGKVTSKFNKLTLEVASNANFATKIDSVSFTNLAASASSTISFAPNAGVNWSAESYYKFIFNVSCDSKNQYVELNKVDFFEAASDGTLDSIDVALADSASKLYAGEKILASDLIVTPVYSTGASDPITDGTGVYFDDQYATQELILLEGTHTYSVFYKDVDGKTATSQIEITALANRSLTTFEIVTPSNDTMFTVGDAFKAAGIEMKATYGNGDVVVYSEANQNLDHLVFDPALGAVLETAGPKMVTISLETKSVTYGIEVIDHIFAEKITDLKDLWDGQQVYIATESEKMAAQTYGSGTYVPAAEKAVFDSTKGFQVDSVEATAYTIVRKRIGAETFWAFFDGTNYLAYTLEKDDNQITAVSEIDDKALWRISPDSKNVGSFVIANKAKANRHMQFNKTLPRLATYTGTQVNPNLYKVTAYDLDGVAKAFVDRYMAMDSTTDGQCVTLYGPAKEAFNALSEDEKLTFSINHEDAYNRLIAWATYHGDELSSNMDLVAKARVSFLPGFADPASKVAVIAGGLSLFGVIGVAGFLFYRKRKANRE